ncbi:MAG: pentapeptide repeat-containing protein [Proteobacteria bacterium]|nr:pentapeptide repeat-containing protein [Pseudomonadota bacterium]
MELDGRTLADATLYGELYPFDFINGYHLAGLWFDRAQGDWRVVLGDDHGACWTNYRTLRVADYFGQLERELGGLRRWPVGDADEPRALWALEPARGRHDFPQSSEPRGESDMNSRLIRRLAENSPAFDGPALDQALEAHRRFVEEGDAELEWELLAAGGIPFCVYGGTTDEDGDALQVLDDAGTAASALPLGASVASIEDVVQAIDRAFAPLHRDPRQLVLRLKRLAPDTALAGRDFSCADFSCALAEGVSFRDATLDRSIAIDGFFDGANFDGASLANVDFTRSSLRGCTFRGAVLSDTDFQDTDLTGADFTGADVGSARFPGAVLDSVRR